MISSPSAQIVNAIAEKTFIKGHSGEPAPAYGPTMGVATAIIATGIIVTTAFGPEKRGRRFETAVAGVNPNPAAEQKVKDIEAGFELERKATEERVERAEKV